MTVAPLTGKALESVRLSTSRLNVFEGSVRSGKTVASLLAFLRFLRGTPAGTNLLMAGKTERSLKRNIIDPLTEMLGPARCRLVSGSGELWLLGRRIYLAGALDERAQEKIRGLSLTGAYGDEVSTWPESFWRMLLSRLSDPGARLYATTNPDSPGHFLKRDFLDRASVWLTHDGDVLRDDGPESLDLSRLSFRLPDNPYLPADYVESLEREFTGLWRRRFVEGLWVVAAGAVYDMWDPDRHVVDILPPITRWLCCSVDYGQANPFHALLLGLGDDNVLYAVSEWRHDARRTQRQMTDVEYSEHLRDWLNTVPVPATRRPDGSWLRGVEPEYMIVDPSAASFRVQLYRDGRHPVAADNAVLDGIRLIASLLHSGNLKISRDCPALITEMSGYSWDDTAAAKGEDKPVKVDDHGLDALRYGCMTTRALWQSVISLALPEAA